MPYEVVWTGRAKRKMKGIGKKGIKRITMKVEEASRSPYLFFDRLVGVSAWKMRVGSYRVIADIDEKMRKVVVLKVGHRKSIYKQSRAAMQNQLTV